MCPLQNLDLVLFQCYNFQLYPNFLYFPVSSQATQFHLTQQRTERIHSDGFTCCSSSFVFQLLWGFVVRLFLSFESYSGGFAVRLFLSFESYFKGFASKTSSIIPQAYWIRDLAARETAPWNSWSHQCLTPKLDNFARSRYCVQLGSS